MAKAAGDDTLRRQAQQKINQLTAKYKDFSDKAGLPTKMERAQMSGFRKVKTNDELKKKVANGENSSIIEMYRGKGIDVTYDSRISSKTIKQVKKATKKITSDFKVLESYSEPIVFGDVDGGLSNNDYDPKTGLNIITLRKADFASPNSLLKKLNADYVSGFSYETDTIQSLVAHEMGHNAHIALALKRTHLTYGVPLTPEQESTFKEEYNKISQEIYIAAFDKESYTEIQSMCISELGSTTNRNPHELIAQSFGCHYYGKKKSLIADKVIKYFKKELK